MATSTAVRNDYDVSGPCATSTSMAASMFGASEASRGCAIDLVHLSRQTLGDRALETELLRLFAHQCAQIMEKVERCGEDVRAAADLAHTLKGSARAIGAHFVATAAERYETGLATGEAAAFLPALREAAHDARGQVQKLLGEN